MRSHSCVISLMTLLAVLCLCVFSMLSLATARSDLELSRLNAQGVSAWYRADLEANREYDKFALSEDDELCRSIPVSEKRRLHLHLVRSRGEVDILSWNCVTTQEELHPWTEY